MEVCVLLYFYLPVIIKQQLFHVYLYKSTPTLELQFLSFLLDSLTFEELATYFTIMWDQQCLT